MMTWGSLFDELTNKVVSLVVGAMVTTVVYTKDLQSKGW